VFSEAGEGSDVKYDDECDGATDIVNDDEPTDGKRKGAADEHHVSETKKLHSF